MFDRRCGYIVDSATPIRERCILAQNTLTLKNGRGFPGMNSTPSKESNGGSPGRIEHFFVRGGVYILT